VFLTVRVPNKLFSFTVSANLRKINETGFFLQDPSIAATKTKSQEESRSFFFSHQED